IKFFATRDGVSQYGEKFAGSFDNFRKRINESLVIARLMSFHRRRDRRHDVQRVAVFRKENLNARACGFSRLNKDKLVFVRQNHCSPQTPRTIGKRSPVLAESNKASSR